MTLTKSGLKSLLVVAEGGGWRRRGIRWRQGRLHLMTTKTTVTGTAMVDDFLSDVALNQERDVVQKFFFFSIYFSKGR